MLHTRESSYTVIIATRNYGRFLATALNSVRDQTHAPERVIVVDDGSVDDTPDILREWQPWAECITLSGEGQGAAWNVGFERVRTEWTSFLDADDFWLPQRAERCLEQARETGADVVMHDLVTHPNGHEWVGWTSTIPLEGKGRDLLVAKGVPWRFVPTSGFMARTDLLHKIFPLEAKRWHTCADTPVLYKLAIIGTFTFIDQVLGVYRIHEDNNYQRANRYDSIDPSIVLENLWLIQRVAAEIDSLLNTLGQESRVELRNNYYYLKMVSWIRGSLGIEELARMLFLQARHHRGNLKSWRREICRILNMWKSRPRLEKEISKQLSTNYPAFNLAHPWKPLLQATDGSSSE